jgi:hypothetical protein
MRFSDPATINQILGALDVTGGVAMVWSFIRITTGAGFRTVQARWALFRRGVYALTAIAFFGLGVGRFNNDYPVESGEAAFQIIILFGYIVFPVLRAFGWISQDAFIAVNGSLSGQRSPARPPDGFNQRQSSPSSSPERR